MTRDELRGAVLDGLATVLGSWLLKAQLPAPQRAALKAQLAYWARAEVELDALLTLVPPVETEVRKMAGELTKEQAAKALGIDLSKIDWARVLAVLQAVLAIFAQQKVLALSQGCSEHDKLMHDTVQLNLEAAANCLECCVEAQGG